MKLYYQYFFFQNTANFFQAHGLLNPSAQKLHPPGTGTWCNSCIHGLTNDRPVPPQSVIPAAAKGIENGLNRADRTAPPPRDPL
jgi:hypothetical protein